jgi:hypothetical protein
MINIRKIRWARRGMHIGYWLESQKETTRKTTHRWGDNMNVRLRETGYGSIDRIDVHQDSGQWRALVNTVLNLEVPINA